MKICKNQAIIESGILLFYSHELNLPYKNESYRVFRSEAVIKNGFIGIGELPLFIENPYREDKKPDGIIKNIRFESGAIIADVCIDTENGIEKIRMIESEKTGGIDFFLYYDCLAKVCSGEWSNKNYDAILSWIIPLSCHAKYCEKRHVI